MRLERPRQWGGGWLALQLWRQLELDDFWSQRLPVSRKGTRWSEVLLILVVYRLLSPGSEWRLHREWYGRSALPDLLGMERVIDEHALYACHDLLLEHKAALFDHLVGRWRDLFNVSFDVLLYDLTSTYFEIDPPLDEHSKRQCGKAHRTWLMDRGIPTEEVLQQMRLSDPPVQYLVGTPKGRLTALERALLQKPWMKAREDVRVKLLAQDQELYVFAESRDRIAKERGMRRRQLKWLWQRLQQLSTMPKLTRDQSHGVRSGQTLEVLLAPGSSRRGVQNAPGRSCDPTDLPPARTAHRGASLHRLSRLLPARHARSSIKESLKFALPPQPPPKITAAQAASAASV